MKTKNQKYKEAVERNLKNFERITNHSQTFYLRKQGVALSRCFFGIRRNDTSYDEEIKRVLNLKE